MRASIQHRKIALEQYSKPQRSTLAHGINQRLLFGYQRYLQQTFYLSCSDLKICYDRIVHSPASLALQHLGITVLPIIRMLDTIQRMSHTVRTAYGDSNLTYSGDTMPDDFRHFMIGLCQENGCAPQLQSIISSIVFSAHQTQGFGIHFVDYFTVEIAQYVVFSYVDNCDMIQ